MSTASQDSPSLSLDAIERRLLGVLVEKAKTTPDAYPLSLNALRSGCNQKSNRSPQMNLEEDQLDRAAETLRKKGALSLVQGDSRVERYRHLAYEWFGVDKTELALLAELLLRGAQTVGELRGRAARMEPIKGVAELTPVLDSLVEKGLVVYLSPPGRGAVVSHTFFSAEKMARVCRDFGLGVNGGLETRASETPSIPKQQAPHSAPPQQPTANQSTDDGDLRTELLSLRADMADQIASLRDEIEALKTRFEG